MFIEDYGTLIKILLTPERSNIDSGVLFDGMLSDLPFFDIGPHLAPGTLTLDLYRNQEPICLLHLIFDGNMLRGLFQKEKFQVYIKDIRSGWDVLPPGILDYTWQFNQ